VALRGSHRQWRPSFHRGQSTQTAREIPSEDAIQLEISPPPGLKVCGFCHGERGGEARKKFTVVLAIGHALGAHEALSRPDALSGFLEVVYRLFEDGVFVGHDRSIRIGSVLRSLDCFSFSHEHADW
jgi:hypothetical protein